MLLAVLMLRSAAELFIYLVLSSFYLVLPSLFMFHSGSFS